jgi:ATP-binding cassette subfamily F protein 3
MALVTFSNVWREYSGQEVLGGVSFEINAGQKLGLIGVNGCGKTTLLRILCGQEVAQEGVVSLASDLRVGYVPQHVEFKGDERVRDYLLKDHVALESRLREKERVVEAASDDEMKRRLGEYQVVRDLYDQMGGDHFEQRARSMLDALGLSGREDQPLEQLSGGEKNVLAMTHALIAEPNLLVLDEPGNHLDYMGLAWLEDFLVRFRGAVLVVSHNRYLLDRVVGGILELEKGKVEVYPGNYSASRTIRAERLRHQQARYDSHQQRLAHIEGLVQKFADIAQGHASDQSWGKRLSARRSQLERVRAEAVEKPVAEARKVSVDFQAEATRADIALQLCGYGKAFGDVELFRDVDWLVTGGQRWALLGPNGCGKTTLLRDIVRQGRWEDLVIRVGPSLTVGYCSQEQEVLDAGNSVYEELMGIKDVKHEQVLGILARFLFTDEEVHKAVGALSGGERNRLQLARLMLLTPNFLILDEPTNHLDIATCEAVEAALRNFTGTILVVSHDRYFLDQVVGNVAEVKGKGLEFYEGNFSDYWQNRDGETKVAGRVASRGRTRVVDKEGKAKKGGRDWEDRKAQKAERRKAQNHFEKLEKQIAKTEAEKEGLEQKISEAFSDGDHAKGQSLSSELNTLVGQLEQLYADWMSAGEELTK